MASFEDFTCFVTLWILDFSFDNSRERTTHCFTIKMKKAFAGHGHIQHAGMGWKGDDAPRYFMYMISEGANLKTAVPFAYGDYLRQMPKEVEAATDSLTG